MAAAAATMIFASASRATAAPAAGAFPMLGRADRRHSAHGGGADTDTAAAGKPGLRGTVTLTANQFTHLLSLIHFPSAASLTRSPAATRSPAPPLVRARSSPLPVSPKSEHQFPAFSAYPNARTSPSVAGKSLPELFPTVEPGVLLDIARHAFDPYDLYKLDANYRAHVLEHASLTPLPASPLPISSFPSAFAQHALGPREFVMRFYPSLSSLFAPLSTYFRILLAFTASSGSVDATHTLASVTKEYLARLVSFNEEYHWSVVLPYHMAFHEKRLEEMRKGEFDGWAEVDLTLLVKFLEDEENVEGSTTESEEMNAESTDVDAAETDGSLPPYHS